MLATALSASIVGVDGVPVRVEVDVAFGLPGLTIVGLAGSAVLEARERVRAAIRNSGGTDNATANGADTDADSDPDPEREGESAGRNGADAGQGRPVVALAAMRKCVVCNRDFLGVTRDWSADAEQIVATDKPTFIYYLGDHDPSLDIPRTVEQRLREFAPLAEIHFECIAVTPEQIEAWSLPTRPTKGSDSRAGGFMGESVEVDAIPPTELRQLVNDYISMHIDSDALRVVHVAEQSERDVLGRMAEVAA